MKQMFVVIAALIAVHAKATPVKGMKVSSNEHCYSFPVMTPINPFETGYHGILKEKYIGIFEKNDGKWKGILLGVVRRDEAIISEYFRSDLDAYAIVMRQLTWVAGKNPDIDGRNKNFISTDDAIDIVKNLQVITVKNFYHDNTWVASRYLITTSSVEVNNDPWMDIAVDVILAFNGDEKNPAFRLHCFNPIVNVSTPVTHKDDVPDDDVPAAKKVTKVIVEEEEDDEPEVVYVQARRRYYGGGGYQYQQQPMIMPRINYGYPRRMRAPFQSMGPFQMNQGRGQQYVINNNNYGNQQFNVGTRGTNNFGKNYQFQRYTGNNYHHPQIPTGNNGYTPLNGGRGNEGRLGKQSNVPIFIPSNGNGNGGGRSYSSNGSGRSYERRPI